MTSLADRFSYALSEAKKKRSDLSKSVLAKHCGVRPSTVTDWFSGKTQTISRPYGEKAAELLSVSASWLIAGTGEPYAHEGKESIQRQIALKGYVAIDEYFIESQNASNHTLFFAVKVNGNKAWYSSAWLSKEGLNPELCKRFEVSDSSMEPLIWDEDMILVDCSKQIIIPGKVYAIYSQNRLFVRYLYPQPDGSIVLKALNPSLPEVTLRETTDFTLVGRVRERHGDKLLR